METVHMWLAGPPELRREAGHLTTLVSDLQELLRAYGVRSVRSGEPRTYRPTPRGRALLDDALRDGRLAMALFAGEGTGRAKGAVNLVVDVGDGRRPEQAVTISATANPVGTTSLAEVADDFAAFIRRWFGPLGAAAAFVADRRFPSWPYTAHEIERGMPLVASWAEVRRFLRGAFWGTALGPELCARLGGREAILRAAPVVLARPLGEGVWLQLSPRAPAAPEGLAQLAAFLAPLHNWGVDDLARLRPPVTPAEPPRGDTAPLPTMPAHGAPIPVQVPEYDVVLELDHPDPPSALERAVLDQEMALNLHMGAAPDAVQQAALLAAMRAWGEGHLGPVLQRGEPSLDVPGAALRWQLEFFEGNAFDALRDLVRRLRALSGVTVTRIVIGTEGVG